MLSTKVMSGSRVRVRGVGTQIRMAWHDRRSSGLLVAGADGAEALENIRSAIQEYLTVVAEQTQGAEVREVDEAV